MIPKLTIVGGSAYGVVKHDFRRGRCGNEAPGRRVLCSASVGVYESVFVMLFPLIAVSVIVVVAAVAWYIAEYFLESDNVVAVEVSRTVS